MNRPNGNDKAEVKTKLDIWLETHDPDIYFPIERRRLFVQSIMAGTRHKQSVAEGVMPDGYSPVTNVKKV